MFLPDILCPEMLVTLGYSGTYGLKEMPLWKGELDFSVGCGGWFLVCVGLVWAFWWVHCDWLRVGVVCLKACCSCGVRW